MLFLIDYDRPSGKMVSLTRFFDADRRSAEAARLQLELRHRDEGLTREVVILEAASEDALRKTHRRYFESIHELLEHVLQSTR